ncbi:DoxX family protein [Thalassospira marina]|uniref:DoxX family protein n=1 Tax=Thalassospira marina TaxID=2048283 RepID=A0A2N3KW41_9PROT|nr:DoxX family protein [Thalassospira marina]PKR54795.1 hypothetical protein COO20_08665 [Thalassospira marina]
MPDISQTPRTLWIGRAASALVVIALLLDGASQFLAPASIATMMQETGFDMALTPALGSIMLGCAILYALPATRFLGAILVTGFLGGAICAHFRLGEIGSAPQIASLLLGALTWGGLYLRDPRLHPLLPLTR